MLSGNIGIPENSKGANAMNDLIGATKQRSSEKVLHTMQTILQMLENDELVNFYTVSGAAGVSRPFLYSHPELRNKIEDCRVTGMTKRELQQEIIRLRSRVRELEERLNQR